MFSSCFCNSHLKGLRFLSFHYHGISNPQGYLQLSWNTLIKWLETVLWTASTVLSGLRTIKLPIE